MAEIAVIDTANEPETNTNTAEIVEEVSDGIAAVIETVQEAPEAQIPPPASQGEYALSAAMLAAIERIENVSTTLVETANRLTAITTATEEVAEVLESAIEADADETDDMFISEEERQEADVPPSNRRNAIKGKWFGK